MAANRKDCRNRGASTTHSRSRQYVARMGRTARANAQRGKEAKRPPFPTKSVFGKVVLYRKRSACRSPNDHYYSLRGSSAGLMQSIPPGPTNCTRSTLSIAHESPADMWDGAGDLTDAPGLSRRRFDHIGQRM